jgi:radical SAM superfamily enzyme YgiQ (UPF0313 family)
MKVLVINPPDVSFGPSGILIEPIDVLNIAQFVKSMGHAVRLLDMDAHRISPERLSLQLENKRFDAVIVVYDYHIPLHHDGTLRAVKEIAGRAKAHDCKVVVLGKAATYKPEEFLCTGTSVDVLVRHEAEPALRALLQHSDWSAKTLLNVPGISFLTEEGRINTTDRPRRFFPLDELPIPDRNLVDLDAYIDVRTLLSSRGCPMKCSFCHVPGFWGNWRARSPGSVVEEIEMLVNDHGAEKILFLDDNATVNRKRMIEICEKIIERNISVTMGCLGSLCLFDEKLMERMYRAGFRWIHYGIETGADELSRGINKKVTVEEARYVVGMTREIGFRVRTSWIMDLPGATEDHLQRTADLILELRTQEIRLHHLAIRMGSHLSETHGGPQAPQYIHGGTQNLNLCNVASDKVAQIVGRITKELENSSYAVVRDPDEFSDVEGLRKRSPGLNIVSLCPMRYGLGWSRESPCLPQKRPERQRLPSWGGPAAHRTCLNL